MFLATHSFLFSQQLEDLQGKYNAELQHSAELTQTLDRTEVVGFK